MVKDQIEGMGRDMQIVLRNDQQAKRDDIFTPLIDLLKDVARILGVDEIDRPASPNIFEILMKVEVGLQTGSIITGVRFPDSSSSPGAQVYPTRPPPPPPAGLSEPPRDFLFRAKRVAHRQSLTYRTARDSFGGQVIATDDQIGPGGRTVDEGMSDTRDAAEGGDTGDDPTRHAPLEIERIRKHAAPSSVATSRAQGTPKKAKMAQGEQEVDLYSNDELQSDRTGRVTFDQGFGMDDPEQQGDTMRTDQSIQSGDGVQQQDFMQQDEPVHGEEEVIQQGQASSSAPAGAEFPAEMLPPPPQVPRSDSENTPATVTGTISSSTAGSTRRFMFPEEEKLDVGPKEQGKKGRRKELTGSGLNPYTILSISNVDKKASAQIRPRNATYNRARPTQCFMSMNSPSKWPERLALPPGLDPDGRRSALAPLWEDPFSECPECVWRRSNAKDKDGNLSETGIQCFYFLGETKLRLLPRAAGEEVAQGPGDGAGVAAGPDIVPDSTGAGPSGTRAPVVGEEGVGEEGIGEEGVGEEESVDEDEAAWMGPISGPRKGPRRRM